MIREFGRSIDNPEKIVEILEEREGTERITDENDPSYSDEVTYSIEEMMDQLEEDERREATTETQPQSMQIESQDNINSEQGDTQVKESKDKKQTSQSNKRARFIANIKYIQDPKPKTPLEQAKMEFRRALQSGDKQAILTAREALLDIQLKEDEEQFRKGRLRINQMKSDARRNGNSEGLSEAQKEQRNLYYDMEKRKLRYLTEKQKNLKEQGQPSTQEMDEQIAQLTATVRSLESKLGIKDQETEER